MSKLDLSDPLKDLSGIEREFVDYLLSEVELHPLDLKAKFGDELDTLRNNLSLRRIVADFKIARNRRASLVDIYRLEEVVKTVPLCIKTLVEVMKTGKEHNRVAAASKLIGPSLAYLERLGSNMANIESIEEASDAAREIIIRADKQDLGL